MTTSRVTFQARWHTMRLALLLPLIAALLLAFHPCAGAQSSSRPPFGGGEITDMKLMTHEVGWVAMRDHLFWTTNGGRQWEEITPRALPRAEFVSVFFLDPQHGWVLMRERGDHSTPDAEEEIKLHLASSSSGGSSWSTIPVTLPKVDPNEAALLPSQATIGFSDLQHGWMEIPVGSSSAFSLGILLQTSDGGRTWALAPAPARTGKDWSSREGLVGDRGPIVALSPSVLWLVGGVLGTRLEVTRDGARHWRAVELPAPRGAELAMHGKYGLPTFRDAQHGWEVVIYRRKSGDETAVLFKTEDGGKTWKADRLLVAESRASIFLSTMVDSHWIIVRQSADAKALTLTRYGPEGKTDSDITDVAGTFAHLISFADSKHGWMRSAKGLLVTSDGGLSWSVAAEWRIPPPGVREYRLSQSKSPSVPDLAASPWAPQAAGAPLVVTSQQLGFNVCGAQDVGKMAAWWTNSPYSTVGFYANGAAAAGTGHWCGTPPSDPNLTASWVSTVLAQGWGLMPLWSNLQAPCSGLRYTFDWNPRKARMQGISEADLAMQTMTTLGLPQGAL